MYITTYVSQKELPMPFTRNVDISDFDDSDWDAVHELMSNGYTRDEAARAVRDTKDNSEEEEEEETCSSDRLSFTSAP